MIEMQQIFGLLKELELVDITMVDEVLTISTVSTQVSPCCPLCGVHASRIHSTYRRQMADVPCGGQYVRLLVQVRKFFCDNTSCARKIFAERLTPFVAPGGACDHTSVSARSGCRSGHQFTEITRRVGLSRRTIERWIKEGAFPEAKRRRKRRSIFDPYAEYVFSRWEQGCTNGLQLWQEIQAQGYQGSAQTLYRYLRGLRVI